MVAGLFDTYYFQLYSQPAIAAPPDLRGKTIAASGARAASERAIIDVLEPYGMEMGRDYQVTYVGSQGGRLAALQQGIVDATIIAPPLGLKAREAGYRELVDLIKLGIPFGHFVITGATPGCAPTPTPSGLLARLRHQPGAGEARPRGRQAGASPTTPTRPTPRCSRRATPRASPVARRALGPRRHRTRGARHLRQSGGPCDAAPQTFYNNGYLQDLEAAGFFRAGAGR